MNDASKIGQEKAIQNPEDALRQEQGVYDDAAQKLPVTEKLPISQMPMGPDPKPFGNMK